MSVPADLPTDAWIKAWEQRLKPHLHTPTPTPQHQPDTSRTRLPAWHNRRRLTDLRTDGPYTHCTEPIRIAQRWLTRVHNGDTPVGLYLHGPIGAGKTSIAAALAVELDEPEFARWWEARDLLAEAKAGFDRRGEPRLLERVVRHRLLFLDDVGKGRQSEWAREAVADVLERRFDRECLTVVTSNHAPAALQLLLGDAAFSRLSAMTYPVPIVGPDLRRRYA